MEITFEDQVRERAYHIWLADGMADGRAHEHWVCAEQTLRGETKTSDEPVVIITKSAAKAGVTKPARAAKAKPAKAAKVVAAKPAKAAKPTIAKAKAGKSPVAHATTH